MAALFLPGTLAPRLVFLFVILFSVAVFPIPEWLKVAFGVPAVAALIGAVYVIRELLGEWDPDPGTSTWDMTFATIWWVVALIGLYAIPAGLAFLVSLVGGGEGFAAAYQAKPYFQAGSVGWVEIVLVLATLWLLIGVPTQAFMAKVDNDGEGDAQRVMVGLIRTAACVLTGVYLFLMSFPREPLHKLHSGPLIAGILVTVVLVAPFYKSLATAFWKRGVAGVISYEAFKKHWGNASMEVRDAFDWPADYEATGAVWERVLARVVVYKGLRHHWWFTAPTEVPKARGQSGV